MAENFPAKDRREKITKQNKKLDDEKHEYDPINTSTKERMQTNKLNDEQF